MVSVDKYDLFVMSLARCGTNFISRCLDSHPQINPLGYTRNEIITRHHRVDIFNNGKLSYYHLHVVNNFCYWDVFSQFLTKKFFLYTIRNPLELAVSFYNFKILYYHIGCEKQKPHFERILLERDFLVRQNSIAIGLSLESQFLSTKCIGFSSLKLDNAQNTIHDISSWLGIEHVNIESLSSKSESPLSVVLSLIPFNLVVASMQVQIYFCELESGPAISGLPRHILRKYIKIIEVQTPEYGTLYGFIDKDFFASIAEDELIDILDELSSDVELHFESWIEKPLSILNLARSEYIERIPKSISKQILDYYHPYVSLLKEKHANILNEW